MTRHTILDMHDTGVNHTLANLLGAPSGACIVFHLSSLVIFVIFVISAMTNPQYGRTDCWSDAAHAPCITNYAGLHGLTSQGTLALSIYLCSLLLTSLLLGNYLFITFTITYFRGQLPSSFADSSF